MAETAVKSADRVLTLIERLGDTASEMSHTELAAALDIPKSSLTQLLRTLVSRRWLSYAPDSRTYTLGPAIAALAQQSGQIRDLTAFAPAILAQLTAATAETSALNIRKGDETEVITTEPSPRRLLSMMRLGDRAPLYATSGGKAILAFLPDTTITAYLDRVKFRAFTPNTLRSKKLLHEQLAQIRSERVARSFEEFTPGVVGLSCPVVDKAGRVLASVNIALPASRYSKTAEDRQIREIQDAVATLLGRCDGPTRQPGQRDHMMRSRDREMA